MLGMNLFISLEKNMKIKKWVREVIPVDSTEILEGSLADIIDRFEEILRKYPQFDKIWLEKSTYEDDGYDEYEFVGEREETDQEEKERLKKNKKAQNINKGAVKEAEIELMKEIAKKYDFTIMVNDNQ